MPQTIRNLSLAGQNGVKLMLVCGHLVAKIFFKSSKNDRKICFREKIAQIFFHLFENRDRSTFVEVASRFDLLNRLRPLRAVSEKVFVFVCVCLREREREREKKVERESESER